MMIAVISIKNKNEKMHKLFISGALTFSFLFLVLYLVYHFSIGEPVKYSETGFIRTVYFTILISHTILAIVILPLIIKSIYHAVKDQREKHKKIVRITFPIWAYVSVTGVIIYLMLWGF